MRRPFRHLCPEADARDAMTDQEFWNHVYGGDSDDEWLMDGDEPSPMGLGTCETCGADGACGYDTLGRPLIHTSEPEA